MPTFEYKARTGTGEAIAGVMDAESEEQLLSKLQNLSYMPVRVTPSRERISPESKPVDGWAHKVSVEDIIVFNMQLGGMIDAGITLLNALHIVGSQTPNQRLKNIIGKVEASVASGSGFHEALSLHPKVFSPFYLGMIKAGEASGTLNAVLGRIAIYLEKQQEIKRRINSALFYPVVLLVVSVIVVAVITIFVLPKFVKMFTEAHVQLPMATQLLYSMSIWFKHFWYLFFFGTTGLIFLGKYYLRTLDGQWRLDKILLSIPVIGLLLRKIIVARFCRTLAALLSSGVSILMSLQVVTDIVGNRVVSRVIKTAQKSVERGERLDMPLKQSGEFPDDAVHMISVGEESGKLSMMLDKIADFYEAQTNYQLNKLVLLIEPLFIIFMGAVVGIIMASMILPVFDMVKTIHR